MLYNNWSMFLALYMANQGHFKNCSLTLLHGQPPQIPEQWQEEFMALFLNDRRADWIARYELKDSYSYRVDRRIGTETVPQWGDTNSDLYFADFDRPEDTLRINLAPVSLLNGNDAWLASGQPAPTWFAVTGDAYGPSGTANAGSTVRLVGKVGVVSGGLDGSELVRLIREPDAGQYPAPGDIIPFTVPIGG